MRRARVSARRCRSAVLLGSGLAVAVIALTVALLAGSGAAQAQFIAALALALAALASALSVVLLARAGRTVPAAGSPHGDTSNDPLTGLPNAMAMKEHLVRSAAHARRRVEPVSALLIDLCALGAINARYGRRSGDEALQAFAACLRDTLRANDVYGRMRDDKFLVLLPGTIRVQAEIVAERLCAHAAGIQLPGPAPVGLRLSVGCATAVQATADELLSAAQEELRCAKALRTPTGRVRA